METTCSCTLPYMFNGKVCAQDLPFDLPFDWNSSGFRPIGRDSWTGKPLVLPGPTDATAPFVVVAAVSTVSEKQFSQAFRQAPLHLDRMSKDLQGLLKKEGIEQKDLGSIAGKDRVIRGNEWTQLYQLISSKGTSSKKGNLARVFRIYSALQKELAERKKAKAEPQPQPLSTGRPKAGLRSEPRVDRKAPATAEPAPKPETKTAQDIQTGWDERVRKIGKKKVETHTVIAPTVATRIQQFHALPPAKGRKYKTIKAYTDAMVAADKRAELRAAGDRRGAWKIKRPEGVPSSLWNLTPALSRWGISAKDAQYFMVTGTLPDLLDEKGKVVKTGAERMTELEKAATKSGSWTAVNSFTFLVGMRRSALAAERQAINAKIATLPADSSIRGEAQKAVKQSEQLDKALRRYTWSIYKQASHARERIGRYLIGKASKVSAKAAEARAAGKTDEAKKLDEQAQRLRDRGARYAYNEAKYRSKIRGYSATSTYRLAARAQVDKGTAKVDAMRRGDTKLTDAAPPELTDATTTANGVPGAGNLLRSAGSSDPKSGRSHGHLRLERLRQNALATFHQTHVQKSGYNDRVGADGTRPTPRSTKAQKHRQAYFDARSEETRVIGERLKIYGSTPNLSAAQKVDAGQLAAQRTNILQEMGSVVATSTHTDKQAADQTKTVGELKRSRDSAAKGAGQAVKRSGEQRKMSQDAVDATDAWFGDTFKTSGEERRDKQARVDARTARSVTDLQTGVARAQHTELTTRHANANDRLAGVLVQQKRDAVDAKMARRALGRALPSSDVSTNRAALRASRREADKSARLSSTYLASAEQDVKTDPNKAEGVSLTTIAHTRLDLSRYWINSTETSGQLGHRKGATARLKQASVLTDQADDHRRSLTAGSEERRSLASGVVSNRSSLASAYADYRPKESWTQLGLAEGTLSDLKGDKARMKHARADIGVGATNALVRHNTRFFEVGRAGHHVDGADDFFYLQAKRMLGTKGLPDRPDVRGAKEMMTRVDRALDKVPQIFRTTASQIENGQLLAGAQSGAISRSEITAAQATMSSVITGPVWLLSGGYVDMKEDVGSSFEKGANSHRRQTRRGADAMKQGAHDLANGFVRSRRNGQAFRFLNAVRMKSVDWQDLRHKSFVDARHRATAFLHENVAGGHLKHLAPHNQWSAHVMSSTKELKAPNPLAAAFNGSVLGYQDSLKLYGDPNMAHLTQGMSFMLQTRAASIKETTKGMGWIIAINTAGEVGLGIVLTAGLGSAGAVAKGGHALNAGRTGLQAANTAKSVSTFARAAQALQRFRQSHQILHTIGVTTTVGATMMGANYVVGKAVGRNTSFARGFEAFTNFIPIGVANRAVGLGSAARRATTLGSKATTLAKLRHALSWGSIKQALSWGRVAAHARFYGPQLAMGSGQAALATVAIPAAAEKLGLERNEFAQAAMGLFLNVFTAASVAGGMRIAGRRAQASAAAKHLVDLTNDPKVPQSTRAKAEKAAFARINAFQKATDGRIPTNVELTQLRTGLAKDLKIDPKTKSGAQRQSFLDGAVESMRVSKAAEMGLMRAIGERRGLAISPDELSPKNPPDKKMVHRAVDIAAKKLYEARGGEAKGASLVQAYRDAALHLSQVFDGHAARMIGTEGPTKYSETLLEARNHAGDRANAVELSTRLTTSSTDGKAPVVPQAARARLSSFLSTELGRARKMLDADAGTNMREHWKGTRKKLIDEVGLTPKAADSTLRLMQADTFEQGSVRHAAAAQLAAGQKPLTNAQLLEVGRKAAKRMGYQGDAVEILARDLVQRRPHLEQAGFVRAGGETKAEAAFRAFRAKHPDVADLYLKMTPDEFVKTFGENPDGSRLKRLSGVKGFADLLTSDPKRARALVDAPKHLDVGGVAQKLGLRAAELFAESPAALAALVRKDGNTNALKDPVKGRARALQLAAEYAKRIDPNGTVKFETLSGTKASAILSKAKLETHTNMDLQLTPAKLAELGLEPRYSVTVDGVKMHLSEPFDLGHGRRGMVGYVEKDGDVHARIFYRSNSQALWRTSDASDGGHYGKGLGEVDTQLPIDLNVAVHRMAQEGAQQVGDGSRIFRGLTREVNDAAIKSGKVVKIGGKYWTPDYAAGRKPIELGESGGQLPAMHPAIKVDDPAKMKLPPPEKMPDFSAKPEATFEFHSDAYAKITGDGNLTGKVFKSKDGKVRYLVLEDSKGRATIAGAEKVGGEVTKYGNRREYIDLNGMDAPLFEYGLQMSKKHGGEMNTEYRLNWRYASETPLVKQYYAKRGKQPPPALIESPVTKGYEDSIGKLRGEHNQRALHALVDDRVSFGLDPAVEKKAKNNLRAYLARNGEAGAKFVDAVAQSGGQRAVLKLFGGLSNKKIDKLRTHISPEVLKQWRETPAAQRADQVVGDFGRFENLPPKPMTVPHSRHNITQVVPKKQTKGKNTVVEPGVDMAADLALINQGKGTRKGNEFEVNGRVYGLHPESGKAFPIRGKGFHVLNRAEYNALALYNQHGGDTEAARAAIAQNRIDAQSAAKALEIYKLGQVR